VYFKHNDMRDLEKKLLEQQQLDIKNPKKAAKTRRFLVAEGIYVNTGEMCPLRELVELRSKFKLRLFLDETISFGTIGQHGRGITELLCVDKEEVDLISASLEHSVESIGGFCVGSHFIVEHQRLSGLGYCFSASQPPFLTQAAISALDVFESEPKIFHQLNDIAEKVDEQFRFFSKLELRGHPISPVKHLYLKDVKDSDECERILRKISDEVRESEFNFDSYSKFTFIFPQCIRKGLAVAYAEYLPVEKFAPRRSLRITVNRLLTGEDIAQAYKLIEEISKSVA
jgi:serine palmitoyltransferase